MAEARTGFAFWRWDGFLIGRAGARYGLPGRSAKYRVRRPSSLSTAARTWRIASAPADRFPYLSRPFTRPLNSPTSDSTQLLVTGKPARR